MHIPAIKAPKHYYILKVLISNLVFGDEKMLFFLSQTTLDALRDAKNERLWFKTMTKLGKLYYDREEYSKLSKILKQLHTSCMTQEGEDDLKKGTQLLEIYALEIQVKKPWRIESLFHLVYLRILHPTWQWHCIHHGWKSL